MGQPQVQRKIRTGGLIVALAFASVPALAASYTATVSFSSPSLYADFLARTTTAYETKVTPSQYFPNTVAVAISGSKNVSVPTPPNLPTFTQMFNQMITNSTETYTYGWANGLEYERSQNVNLVWQMQNNDLRNNTCGGQPFDVNVSTIPALATSRIMSICMGAYRLAVSSITERDYMIFTTTGGVVSR